jgi:hypothetical protein
MRFLLSMSEINLQVIIAYQGNIVGDAEKKPLQDAARQTAPQVMEVSHEPYSNMDP